MHAGVDARCLDAEAVVVAEMTLLAPPTGVSARVRSDEVGDGGRSTLLRSQDDPVLVDLDAVTASAELAAVRAVSLLEMRTISDHLASLRRTEHSDSSRCSLHCRRRGEEWRARSEGLVGEGLEGADKNTVTVTVAGQRTDGAGTRLSRNLFRGRLDRRLQKPY